MVQLKGPYDIALNKQADGTFGLTADLWQGHVEKEVGQEYGKLLQLYGVHKATIEARKKGLSVLRRPSTKRVHQARAHGGVNMNRTIEIIIAPLGKSKLTPWDSKDRTAKRPLQFLEEALGMVGKKIKKPEYHQRSTRVTQQKVGA